MCKYCCTTQDQKHVGDSERDTEEVDVEKQNPFMIAGGGVIVHTTYKYTNMHIGVRPHI